MARKEEKNKSRGLSSSLVESTRTGNPILPINVGHGVGKHSIYEDRSRLYDIFSNTRQGAASSTQEAVRNLKRSASGTSYRDIGRRISQLDVGSLGKNDVLKAWENAARAFPDAAISNRVSQAISSASTPFEILAQVREGLRGTSRAVRETAAKFMGNVRALNSSMSAGGFTSASVSSTASEPVTQTAIKASVLYGMTGAGSNQTLISNAMRGEFTERIAETMLLDRDNVNQSLLDMMNETSPGIFEGGGALNPNMMLGYTPGGDAILAGKGAKLVGARATDKGLELSISRAKNAMLGLEGDLAGTGEFADLENYDLATSMDQLGDEEALEKQIYDALNKFNYANMQLGRPQGTRADKMRQFADMARAAKLSDEEAGLTFGAVPFVTGESPEDLVENYGFEESWVPEISKGRAVGSAQVTPVQLGGPARMKIDNTATGDIYSDLNSRRVLDDEEAAYAQEELLRSLTSMKEGDTGEGGYPITEDTLAQNMKSGGRFRIGRGGVDNIYIPPEETVSPDLSLAYREFLKQAADEQTPEEDIRPALDQLLSQTAQEYSRTVEATPVNIVGGRKVRAIPPGELSAPGRAVGISRDTFEDMMSEMEALPEYQDMNEEVQAEYLAGLANMSEQFYEGKDIPAIQVPSVLSEGKRAEPIRVRYMPGLSGAAAVGPTPGEDLQVALPAPQHAQKMLSQDDEGPAIDMDGVSTEPYPRDLHVEDGIGRLKPGDLSDQLVVSPGNTAEHFRRASKTALELSNESVASGDPQITRSKPLEFNYGDSIGIAHDHSYPVSNIGGDTPLVRPDLQSAGMGDQVTPENIHPHPQQLGQPTAPNILMPEPPAIDTNSEYMSAMINVRAKSGRYKVDPGDLTEKMRGTLGERSKVNTRVYDDRSSLTAQKIADILDR